MAAGQGCEGGGRDRGQGDGGGKDQGQGGVGVGEVGKGAAGYGYALYGLGWRSGRTQVATGGPSQPDENPISDAPGRTQQRHSQCSRSVRSCGRLGFNASAARRESISPPGLEPRSEKTAAHPLDHLRRFSRKVQYPPMRPSQEVVRRGGAPCPTHQYPGLGVRRVSGLPVACANESRKQTSHRNTRLTRPGFPH